MDAIMACAFCIRKHELEAHAGLNIPYSTHPLALYTARTLTSMQTQVEEHVIMVQKANLQLRANALSTVHELKQGQQLLREDVIAKTKAIDLAIGADYKYLALSL